jgi:hypothetical protein
MWGGEPQKDTEWCVLAGTHYDSPGGFFTMTMTVFSVFIGVQSKEGKFAHQVGDRENEYQV